MANKHYTEYIHKWPLRHLGIQFESEDVTLESAEFSVPSPIGMPTQWKLQAYCTRLCPESMIRVYVRLVSLNNFTCQGRYTLKSFYQESHLADHQKVAEVEADGFLSRNLRHVAPDLEPQYHSQDVFIGWSGRVSEYLSKIVFVQFRIFGIFETIRPVTKLSARISLNVEEELKWRMIIFYIYQKLVSNIQQQLKERLLNDQSPVLNTEANFEILDEQAVKVYHKLVDFARSKAQICSGLSYDGLL